LNITVEEGALVQIGHLADGSLRDGESLLDQLICFGSGPITETLTRDLFGLIGSSHLEEIDKAITAHDVEKAVSIGSSLYNSGRDIGACLDHLLDHYRSHLTSSQRFNKIQCLNIIETLLQWQQASAKTPFKQVHLEMCLVALVKSARRIPLDELISRL